MTDLAKDSKDAAIAATTALMARFEAGKVRHASMKDRVTRLTAIREAEAASLQRTEAEAQDVLGTSDVAAIRRMFQEGTAKNTQVVETLEKELSQVDQQLSDIERLVTVR